MRGVKKSACGVLGPKLTLEPSGPVSFSRLSWPIDRSDQRQLKLPTGGMVVVDVKHSSFERSVFSGPWAQPDRIPRIELCGRQFRAVGLGPPGRGGRHAGCGGTSWLSGPVVRSRVRVESEMALARTVGTGAPVKPSGSSEEPSTPYGATRKRWDGEPYHGLDDPWTAPVTAQRSSRRR